MDQQPTDRELLREFTEQGLESAFEQLVQRHVDLVFATAFRRLGDRAAAQDLTQEVFIRLHRKAAWLRREGSLAGWLHKTALLASQQWWRGELRRQRREQTAAELNTTMKDEDPLIKSMAGVLDEGLMALGDADRQALILRYFQDRSYREIGAMLGAGEDAVRKRSDKALGKLTDFFRRRGYALPTGAAAIAAFRAAAEAAPSGLASLAARAALSSGTATSLGGAGSLFAKFMGLSYAQTAAVCALAVAAPITYEWRAGAAARTERIALQNQFEQVQSELGGRQRGLERTQRQIRGVDAELAGLRVNPARAAAKRSQARIASETNPYLWDNESDYVRLPKTMLKEVSLANRVPRGPKPTPHVGTFIGGTLPTDGMFPPLMKEIFGVTPEQTARVEEAFQATWQGFQTVALSHSFPTNAPPARFRLDDMASLTLFTTAFPDEGQAMKQRLRGALEVVLGPERTYVLWEQNQSDFSSRFDDFGALERFETFAVGPDKTVGWSTGVRPPGAVEVSGSEGGRDPRYPLEKVPARFRSFVAETWARLDNQH